jgi:hypothetical protein
VPIISSKSNIVYLYRINDEDFYKIEIIPMYCVCMIELNKVGDLYYLAHKLANSSSDKYISWFAVVRLIYYTGKLLLLYKEIRHSKEILP